MRGAAISVTPHLHGLDTSKRTNISYKEFNIGLPGLKSREYDDRFKVIGIWSLEEVTG